MLRANCDVKVASNDAIPTKNPKSIISQETARVTNNVGLWEGDHSASDLNPQPFARSSKRIPISERFRTTPSIQAINAEISNATTSATIPGRRLATWLINLVMDSINACWARSHIFDSFSPASYGLKRSGHRQRETRYGLAVSKAWHNRSIRCSAAFTVAFCISSA